MKANEIDLIKFWAEARERLDVALRTLNDADLSFGPGGELRTLGDNLAHIGLAEDYWLSIAQGGQTGSWDVAKNPELATVAGLTRRLNEAHEATLAYLGGLDADRLDDTRKTRRGEEVTLRWIFWHVIEHEVHHRGEVYFAMGMHGTPPPGF
ncbi:MAG: DinB family protein [Chloroflexota bacterium]